jgi:hypothetical protein
MKKCLLTVLLAGPACAAFASAREIPLALSDWQAITFDGIKPTLFRQIETPGGEGIELTVTHSSSFLVHAFRKVETISRVRWKMQYSGLPAVANRSEESSRSGDDFVLRVGLIAAGDHKQVSMFAPDWIKQLARILNGTAGNVVYLVASRYHSPGSTWPSPYSGQLSYVSVAEMTDESRPDWLEVSYNLPTPMHVVGLWLMADGDNTHANFQTTISQLRIDDQDSEHPTSGTD